MATASTPAARSPSDAGEDEGKGEATDESGGEGSDRRPDDEAAHLEGTVEAEGLAALVLVGGIHDRAARGGVVDARRRASREAQQEQGAARVGRTASPPTRGR